MPGPVNLLPNAGMMSLYGVPLAIWSSIDLRSTLIQILHARGIGVLLYFTTFTSTDAQFGQLGCGCQVKNGLRQALQSHFGAFMASVMETARTRLCRCGPIRDRAFVERR